MLQLILGTMVSPVNVHYDTASGWIYTALLAVLALGREYSGCDVLELDVEQTLRVLERCDLTHEPSSFSRFQVSRYECRDSPAECSDTYSWHAPGDT
jgi:hypothetical protein